MPPRDDIDRPVRAEPPAVPHPDCRPRHDPHACGLTTAAGRQLCPGCAAVAAEHAATLRSLTGQADAAHDVALDRLQALHDLIVGWPRHPCGLAESWAVSPERQARRRRLLRGIAVAITEAAEA